MKATRISLKALVCLVLVFAGSLPGLGQEPSGLSTLPLETERRLIAPKPQLREVVRYRPAEVFRIWDGSAPWHYPHRFAWRALKGATPYFLAYAIPQTYSHLKDGDIKGVAWSMGSAYSFGLLASTTELALHRGVGRDRIGAIPGALQRARGTYLPLMVLPMATQAFAGSSFHEAGKTVTEMLVAGVLTDFVMKPIEQGIPLTQGRYIKNPLSEARLFRGAKIVSAAKIAGVWLVSDMVRMAADSAIPGWSKDRLVNRGYASWKIRSEE